MPLKLLSLEEVKQSITMLDAIDAMQNAFIQLAQKNVILPLRTVMQIEHGLTLTMPAYLAKDNSLGIKIVSMFPNNPQKNKASINGIILLLDNITGEPLVMMDASYLTALRTGAICGLATKYFSKDIESTLTIVGCGVQALTQLQAILAVRKIKQVFVYSRNLENAKKFVKNLKHLCNIEVSEKLSTSLKKSDIICTATTSIDPFINLKDLQPHVHINAIGSHSKNMQEISDDVLQKSVIIVDQISAAMKEAGEIINAVEQKKIKEESIIELGSWLLNKTNNFQDQMTVFKSVGLAIQDLAVAQVVYQNSLKLNLGTTFNIN